MKDRVFVSGIAAGMCIAIGATAALSVESRIVGALLFAVGLFTICSFRLNLFTGKVSKLGCTNGMTVWILGLIWFGNLVGATIGAYLMRLTRISASIVERAAALCAVKMGDSPLSLFLLAAFCNVMIYIAVEGMNGIGNPTGKYLALIFGVTVFVLCGFEHSIADMYYFAAAGSLTQWRAWACIGIVTIGNAVGGIACHRIRRFVA